MKKLTPLEIILPAAAIVAMAIVAGIAVKRHAHAPVAVKAPVVRAEAPVVWVQHPVPPPPPAPPNPYFVSTPAAKDRFKESVPFAPAQALDGWTFGKVRSFGVFRDEKTGLLWSPKLKLTVQQLPRVPDVKRAMDACAGLAPAGGWALPTGKEFDAAQLHGLTQIDPGAAHDWVTYNDDRPLIAALARAWSGNEKELSVRCVGRQKI